MRLYAEGEDVVIADGATETILSREEARTVWGLLSQMFDPKETKSEPVLKPAEHPDARVERLYAGRIAKGLTPGRAVSYCIGAIGGTAPEIKAALERRGIVVGDGRQSGVTKRHPAEPKPKPITAPAQKRVPPPMARPAEPIVRREYSDDGGCVMLEPRDLLASMPGYGKEGRFVSHADLFRRES